MIGAWLDALSWVCLVAGSLFAVIGGLGLLRFPDFYSRMHAGGITDTMGAGLVLLGLILQVTKQVIPLLVDPQQAQSALTVVKAALPAAKLAMILLLLLVTSPTSAHALAKSALTHGLDPLVVESEEGSPSER